MDCLNLPELNFNEWGDGLLERLNGHRYPIGAMFELTERCNFNCLHCYINQPANCRKAHNKELTTAQAKDILNRAAQAGLLFLTFSGGEPLLRPDFPEIYQHARQLGLIVNLFTNGSLIDESIIDLLLEWRPFSMEITLYGATPETYQRMTGLPGSFARVRKGIELILDHGLPLSLKSILITENVHEIDQMRSFVESLGLKFRYDYVLWPRLDGSKDIFQYQLPIEQMIDLEKRDSERESEYRRMVNKNQGRIAHQKYVFNCGAGQRSFVVDSAGRMNICAMSRSTSFDLLSMSFEHAWEELGKLRHLERYLNTKCETCPIGALCYQCVGWSQAVHNDNETPVDFLCELAHCRVREHSVVI